MKTNSFSTYNPTSLREIIRDYRKWRKNNPDSWFDHCIAQTSLKDAIQAAALSVNARGTMSGHQCLVGHVKLEKWSAFLLQHQHSIQRASTFHALHQLLSDLAQKGKATNEIKGVGEMLLYDTCHRLGGYLGLYPEEVYVHNGTRKGSKNILAGSYPKGSQKLKLSIFPTEFAQENVTASELEDILCIFKDDFAKHHTPDDLTPIKRRTKC